MTTAQITLVGRCGRDAEVKTTSTGKEIVSVNLAVGSGDKSQWYKVTAWEKTGNWLKDAKKGDQVYASGNLEIRQYEKKTGGVGTEILVNAQQVRLFKSTPKNEFTSTPVVSADMSFDEDIPF